MPNRRLAGSRMKLLDYLFAPIALAGLLATGWWGLYQSPQRPANLAAQLEQDANAALSSHGYDWAHVRMKGQCAVLEGPAPSDDAAMGAAETVLHATWPGGVLLGGVTVVQVSVGPGQPVSPFAWRAEKTPEGAYILSGHVPSRRIEAQIVEEATRLADGISPQNLMQVEAGWPGGNWQGVARLGLDLLGEVDAGEVRLVDTTLRVSAEVPDAAKRERLSDQVKNLAAPYRGQPLIRGPAAWTAQQGPEGLVLSGKVRSEAERREILGIAQANSAGEVSDRMEIAPDMPDGWIALVRAGLPHFARFRSGEMGFHPTPGDVGFAVEGEAAGSTVQYLKQDLAGVQAPYPVTVWADPVDVDVPEIAGMDFDTDPAAACAQAFSAVLDANPVAFDAHAASISRESGAALDKLLAVSHRCNPQLAIEIGDHSDSQGDSATDMTLSEARADAVMQYMIRAGVDPARLSAVGYGPDRPVQSNDSPEGWAGGRQIEFRVRTRSD